MILVTVLFTWWPILAGLLPFKRGPERGSPSSGVWRASFLVCLQGSKYPSVGLSHGSGEGLGKDCWAPRPCHQTVIKCPA